MQVNEKKSEITMLICIIICNLTGVFYYGIRAFYICAFSAFVCFVTNAVCCRIRKMKVTDSLSAVICGLQIAAMMSSAASFYVVALTDLFAIIVVRAAFGGKGNEIFSPASAAVLFAQVNFPAILSYPKIFSSADQIVSGTMQRTTASDFEILIGRFSSPIGTSAVIFIIVAAVALFVMKISDITVFAVMTAVYGLFTALFYSVSEMKYSILLEMYLFCAVFFVSANAPKKFSHKFIYGIFVGLVLILFKTLSDVQTPVIYASVLSEPIKKILSDREIVKAKSGGARFASQQGK